MAEASFVSEGKVDGMEGLLALLPPVAGKGKGVGAIQKLLLWHSLMMRDGCETGKRRKRQRKGGRKRKTDHYIADHNFSFSLHALLILQEEKVKRGKYHFYPHKGWFSSEFWMIGRNCKWKWSLQLLKYAILTSANSPIDAIQDSRCDTEILYSLPRRGWNNGDWQP